MIVVKKFVFNPFSENTYIVWDENSAEAMIIDPGCFGPEEELILSGFIEAKKIFLKYLVVTHSHIDHILGLEFITKKYNLKYFAPEDDMPLLKFSDKQAAVFGIEFNIPPVPGDFLSEHKTLKLGNSVVSFIFTPGHTPGEYCLYFKNEQFIFSGDVLFKGSIGRTDLWGGEYSLLISSIKDKLFALPDDTIVYPGHGDNTTIGIEKRDNPFVKF